MSLRATRNATRIWLSLIPIYIVALMCLYIFYEQGHAWKKELVVVGFQYTTNLPFDGTQSMHEQVIAQTHFRGSWVTSETDSDTGVTQELVATTSAWQKYQTVVMKRLDIYHKKIFNFFLYKKLCAGSTYSGFPKNI